MLISTLNCEMWPNFSYRGVRSVTLLLLLLLLMVFSSENFGFSPPYAGIAGIGPACFFVLQRGLFQADQRSVNRNGLFADNAFPKAGSPLGGKMSSRKSFRQSNWLIELSPRKTVEPRIVGLRSTFRGSAFFRLVEIRLKACVCVCV